MPEFIAKLDLEAAALLIESHASDAQTLHAQCEQVMSALQRYHIIESVPFTSESKTVATLWGIRKGMFPAVGAVREVGTTVIIEDVAFPVENSRLACVICKPCLINTTTTKRSSLVTPLKATCTLCSLKALISKVKSNVTARLWMM